MPPPIRTRAQERLGGLFLLASGAVLVWMTWRWAAPDGRYTPAGTVRGPGALVMGPALRLVPGYRSERAARGDDPDAFPGSAALTPRGWGVSAVSLALGLLEPLARCLGTRADALNVFQRRHEGRLYGLI